MIEQKKGKNRNYTFLLAAEKVIEAEAYEEMLTGNGITVVKERYPLQGNFAVLPSEKTEIGINLFVPKDNLDKARLLLYKFNNDPIEYDSTYSAYNRQLKPDRLRTALAIVFLFVLTVLPATISLISKIMNKIQ